MSASEAGQTPLAGRGRLKGAIGGAALVLAVAAALSSLGILVHRREFDRLPSFWTQSRANSADFVAAVLLLAATTLAATSVVVAAVGRRGSGVGVARIAARVVGSALGLAVGAVTGLNTAQPEVSLGGSAGTVASAAVIVGLVACFPQLRQGVSAGSVTRMAVAGCLIAAAASAVVVIRHPVPPREMIDWWAAHDNPPLGWYEALGQLGLAVDADPRDTDTVVEACRVVRREFEGLTGPPRAPSYVADDVTRLAADLSRVADRCESKAATITRDELVRLIEAATDTPSAHAIDKALRMCSGRSGFASSC